MKVKKGNRVVRVNEQSLDRYLKQGYDQIDDKGKIVKRATGGKTIPVQAYNKALDEIDTLKEQIKKLKSEVKKG